MSGKENFSIRRLLIAVLAFFILNPAHISAQNAGARQSSEPLRILLIFDFSNSMFGLWESDSKFNIARKLVSTMVDSLNHKPGVQLALRCYGHQKKYPPQDCDDTKLEVPFADDNAWLIKQKLNKLTPSGTTPIARSLEACASDFPKKLGRNIVILITDGKEECGGDPCAISAALQSKGIILRPFIVGVGNLETDIKNSFNCIGNFYDASTELSFRQVIQIIITQVLNSTTSQVNLLDQSGRPTETDVAMTFYDQKTGQQRYNFIHTMNNKGVPDTLRLDHLNTYRLVVHTIPPREKKDIHLNPGKHNIIAVDVPQGYLKLQGGNGEASLLRDVPCIIRKDGEATTLLVQNFRETSKLICGTYDLEILCLPRVLVEDVKINQSSTTTVKIEEPGTVSFLLGPAGITSVFSENGNQLTWVCNLSETNSQEVLRLQPGRYKAVYRSKAARETLFSLEKSFQVTPGTSVQVIMK